MPDDGAQSHGHLQHGDNQDNSPDLDQGGVVTGHLPQAERDVADTKIDTDSPGEKMDDSHEKLRLDRKGKDKGHRSKSYQEDTSQAHPAHQQGKGLARIDVSPGKTAEDIEAGVA